MLFLKPADVVTILLFIGIESLQCLETLDLTSNILCDHGILFPLCSISTLNQVILVVVEVVAAIVIVGASSTSIGSSHSYSSSSVVVTLVIIAAVVVM